MPQKWTPGRQEGKAVNVYFNLPVKFKLEEDTKIDLSNTLETQAPLLERGKPEDAVKMELDGKMLTLNAFPNPVKEKLTISLEGVGKNFQVTVFDVTGKELFRDNIKAFDGVYYQTLDLDKAAKGALIINVSNKNFNLQKKVIVQ